MEDMSSRRLSGDDKICEGEGSGLFLPILPGESDWNKSARAFMYFVALLWCFLGVSIVADIFMSAIEAVTSKMRPKNLPGGRVIHVKIWNPTVANLTLMALGSSAPEILLSIIEIVANGFYAGELGPSTIVGSAAYNLMVIIAVCVYVIPTGQSRTIFRPTVFAVTAIFSVWAYLWLIVILAITSPNIVEVWEGVLTFVYFPILVLLAWLADIGKLSCCKRRDPLEGEARRQAIVEKLQENGMANLSSAEMERIVKDAERLILKSPAQHRIQASLGTLVGKGGKPSSSEDLLVGFLSSKYRFAEGDAIALEIEKVGKGAKESNVIVHYGIFGMEHELIGRSQASIAAGELTGKVEVALPAGKLPKGSPGDDSFVWVDIISASCSIRLPSLSFDSEGQPRSREKKKSHCRVNVAEDRRRARAFITPTKDVHPGVGQLRFERTSLQHAADAANPTVCKVKVQRFNGTAGQISCAYRTESDSARPTYDYDHTEGVLTFPDGAVEMCIEIRIASKGRYEGQDKFLVHLSEDTPDRPVLASEPTNCAVTILESDMGSTASTMIMRALDSALNMDAIAQGNVQWKEQFFAALSPVSGDDDDADAAEGASAGAWTLHLIALPWKIFFAFIPPVSYMGGWLCFFVALAFIGAVTAVIGDLAALMGCCLGLPDSITAITIVALGTSLPDTFASKVAALEDPSADNAIGNVTGSNSVNVFLGLGLPWMMAAIFWEMQGPTDEWRDRYSGVLTADALAKGGFAVPAGDLAFSVVVFMMTCVATLCTVLYRRYRFSAELGGPQGFKTNTVMFFVLLWLLYIGLASWKALTPGATAVEMVAAIFAGLLTMTGAMILVSTVLYAFHYWSSAQEAVKKDKLAQVVNAVAKLQMANVCTEGIPMKVFGAGGAAGVFAVPSTSRANPLPYPAPPMSVADLASAVAMMKDHLAGLQEVCRSLEGHAALNRPPFPRTDSEAPSREAEEEHPQRSARPVKVKRPSAPTTASNSFDDEALIMPLKSNFASARQGSEPGMDLEAPRATGEPVRKGARGKVSKPKSKGQE